MKQTVLDKTQELTAKRIQHTKENQVELFRLIARYNNKGGNAEDKENVTKFFENLSDLEWQDIRDYIRKENIFKNC